MLNFDYLEKDFCWKYYNYDTETSLKINNYFDNLNLKDKETLNLEEYASSLATEVGTFLHPFIKLVSIADPKNNEIYNKIISINNYKLDVVSIRILFIVINLFDVEILKLNKNDLTIEEMNTFTTNIIKCSNLNSLIFDWQNLNHINSYNFLDSWVNMDILSFRGCNIENNILEEILNNIKNLKELSFWDLYNNNISKDGIEIWIEFIKENKYIENFSFGYNRIKDLVRFN